MTVHPNSLRLMTEIVRKHMPPGEKPAVLDVGARDVNGSYRVLFVDRGCAYTGVDIEAGENVDVVMPSQDVLPVSTGAFDWVISGQCIEHAKHPWLLAAEMGRVCAPGGIVVLIAPMVWGIHRFPIDCWRVMPDGLRVLLEDCAQCEVVEAKASDKDAFAVGRRRKNA